VSRWLYQMSESRWPTKEYRDLVRERRELTWGTRRRFFASEAPAPGDLIFLYYAPSGCDTPGICGLGVVLKYLPKTRRIVWVALPPTDKLKRRPWWDERVEEIIDLIRKSSQRGTMYSVPAVLDTDLRRGLFTWAGE